MRGHHPWSKLITKLTKKIAGGWKPPAIRDGSAPRSPGDPDKYLMISADCHGNEPGNLWRERLDEKFRDRLPHVEVDEKGEKWIVAEGISKSRVRARMIADAAETARIACAAKPAQIRKIAFTTICATASTPRSSSRIRA